MAPFCSILVACKLENGIALVEQTPATTENILRIRLTHAVSRSDSKRDAASTDMEPVLLGIQGRGRFAAESRVAVPNLFSRSSNAKMYAENDSRSPMAVAALKRKPELKTFNATI